MEKAGLTRSDDVEPAWRNAKHAQLVSAREQIDELDSLIATLLVKRLSLARQLKAVKDRLAAPIKDERREAEVLSRVADASRDTDIAQAVRTIYESVIAESRRLQAEAATRPATGAARRIASCKKKAPLYFPRVLIVGLGIIGGSLARQIKSIIPQTLVCGVDSHQILCEAQAQGVIDYGGENILAFVRKASLVVLAAGPAENLRLLEVIAPHLKRRQVVIDVTSTKTQICRLAETLDMKGADFVGGHPLYGSEKTGFAASKEVDPNGKTFCLVPTAKTSEISLKRLIRWLNTLNLIPRTVDATTHDAALAQLSHTVQLLAVALGAQVADELSDEELAQVLSFSGPGFRQLARLMASPFKMWLEIADQNSDEIAANLSRLSARLAMLSEAVRSGDTIAFAESFLTAARIPPALERTQTGELSASRRR